MDGYVFGIEVSPPPKQQGDLVIELSLSISFIPINHVSLVMRNA